MKCRKRLATRDYFAIDGKTPPTTVAPSVLKERNVNFTAIRLYPFIFKSFYNADTLNSVGLVAILYTSFSLVLDRLEALIVQTRVGSLGYIGDINSAPESALIIVIVAVMKNSGFPVSLDLISHYKA
jgi:hypothetical protein